MAIYQPVNVWPTIKAIDVLKDNTFSVEVNTSDSVIAYKLTILDWDNNVVLDEEKVVLSEPLYNGDTLYFIPSLKNVLINGNDYKWRIRLYQESSSIIITSGYIISVEQNKVIISKNVNIEIGMYIDCDGVKKEIVNIEENDETYILTLNQNIDNNINEIYTIYSEFLDTNPEYVLYARTTPEIGFNNYVNEVGSRNYLLTGYYRQLENVQLVYYQIKLSIIRNNNPRLIYDTGKVYRADIKLEYDGYITGNTYQVELTTLNDMGVSSTTGVKDFNVQYETIDFLTEPQLYLNCQTHSIKINWTTPIEFSPTLYNANVAYDGSVVSVVGNTVEIDKNLNINTGDIIIFNNKYENEILFYNKSTGLASLRYSTENDIFPGSSAIVLNNFSGDSNLNISFNDPYRMTNSAYLGETVLTYKGQESDFIGKTPENDNITFQFKLPDSFWEGYLTKNMKLLPIMQLETEENNIRGFEVFVNLNKLVYIKPALSAGEFYKANITNVQQGGVIPNGIDWNELDARDKTWDELDMEDFTWDEMDNVEVTSITSITLDKPIDFLNQKYIRFDGYNDIIEISAYDNLTNTAVLVDKPNFDFNIGDSITVYDTLVYEFYPLFSYFPLQPQNTWNSTYDYIWDDKEFWNDELYWFEGGGAKQRIANTWYKTKINGRQMEVKSGGV